MLGYAITDRTQFAGDEEARQAALLKQAARLAGGEARFLQLRERDLEAGAVAGLARGLQTIFRGYRDPPKLLINSRADVAIATGADGVHLTAAEGSLTPAQVRSLYAAAELPAPVVSVSCHTLAEVGRAREGGASVILFGPVFEKVAGGRAVAEGIGLDLLRNACALAGTTPVLALGGVTGANASECIDAGAAGVAGIRLFLAGSGI